MLTLVIVAVVALIVGSFGGYKYGSKIAAEAKAVEAVGTAVKKAV